MSYERQPYLVHEPTWHDEYCEETVKAFSHRDAARQYIQQKEARSCEYAVASGTATAEVLVRKYGQSEYKKFAVYGVARPTYEAIEYE